ncbi:winged helix-turn-helix domain-containing protein [Aliivibrio sifiae]|uniref:Transcriptional regulator n=1 Tax=Aliivibrio sifiae TaxID=566293 RepID=A0A2S7X7M3_9GAMM|nr:winged helix-turn-helix domain-containing protein [Aliivibrio sifiae]PQJ87132.1 transcriptional regulator [Aliivibrio sifiae]GLR73733.1 transcriptional regulator [Aliivibrio sifiae]
MNKKEIIETTNMTIDYESLTVLIKTNGDEIKLSLNEANLLFLLYSNPNKIYTKDDVYQECWQDTSVSNSVVTQTISLLRKKFLKYDIVVIDTIKQKGYKSGDRLKTVTQKSRYYLLLPLLFFSVAVLFIIYYKKESRGPVEQSLIPLQTNVYMLSTSEHIDLNGIEFNPDYLYFFNKEKKYLSISTCLVVDDICNNSFNTFIMLDSENENYTNIISDVISVKIKKRKRLINNSDTYGFFNLQSNISVSSIKEESYQAKVSYSFYFKETSHEKYNVNRSINISESGYNGNYTNYSDVTVNFNKSSLIAEFVNSDDQDSLIQNGYIQETAKLKIFPLRFKKLKKYNYMHFYIIDDTYSLAYNENEGFSFIVNENY